DLGHRLVCDGGKNPYKLKIRSPTFSNLSCFGEVAEGMLLADALAFMGSLDLVIPEIDR
ncbi:MAG TPA: NADH-quinone oxidoreductase subunit D, partial [Desulfobulbus sp.]|nr:NADH-quinone oxidoreductase subunit D [Desulfobulbus sp.]